MSENASERHNRLAKAAATVIIGGTNADEIESLVVVESLVFAILHHFRPDARQAAEFLDTMTDRILTERWPR